MPACCQAGLNLPSTNFMYYVYVLRNKKNKEFYYGYTGDLKRRINEHNQDWKFIYYEAYLSELDARERERKLKNYGQSRTHLRNRLKETLKLEN